MSNNAKISDFFSKSSNSNIENEIGEIEVPEAPELHARYRSYQHKWFLDYQWLHYDEKQVTVNYFLLSREQLFTT